MAGEALDPAAYIFEGLWTDWTRGRALGLTWTLCPSKATLLTNSLALFVTLAGGQLWTIIRFSLHQLRSARRPKQYSERFLQQQVILRNASTDLHTMRLMAQVGWSSRSVAGRQFLFPIAIVALALTHYIMFVTAGTLSNNLVNLGSEGTFSTKRLNVSSAVLSRSPHCGVLTPRALVAFTPVNGGSSPEGLDDVQIIQDFITKTERNVQLSLEYVRDCYMTKPNYYMSSKCDTFKRHSLHFEERPYTGGCPFGVGSCQDENIVVFDTQAIDSHDDLGMNAQAKNRLKYRRRTTCAVFNDTGRITQQGEATAIATAYAKYGASLLQGTDYTYSWSNFSSLYTEFTPQSTNPYQLNTQIAFASSPSVESASSFEPLPGYQQDTGDLVLLFLSFTGRYFEPIDDPWFSAHQMHFKDVPAEFARRQYQRDRPISTVGCLEQHQFCTADGSCTPFLGWGQVQDEEDFVTALNERQSVTFHRMISAIDASSLRTVTSALEKNSSPLLAVEQCATQSTVLSLRIPDDQWRRELSYWHSISMAQLQRTIAQWGSGQIAPDPSSQLDPPATEGDVWFCNNMMVPSTVYQSFSVVWLVSIISAGTIIILISWAVEDVSDWLHLRTVRSSALRKIWDSYHMLRLTGFMMRNSWGPLPPPKDDMMLIQNIAVPVSDFPPTIRIVSPMEPRLPPAVYSSTYWSPARFSDSYHTSTTPRTWSELPPPPHRDSWVELSLNGFDFQLEESPKGDCKDPEAATNAEQRYSPASVLPPRLEISELRAHAMARYQRDAK